MLSDFGHNLPDAVKPEPKAKAARLFRHHSWRGTRRPGRGWMAAKAPAAAWRMSTDQAPLWWPLIAAPSLPATGVQIGWNVQNGSVFYADPHEWVKSDDIPVTNPNVMLFGKPGGGKSGTTKAFLLRQMQFGYRALILGDTKDEYEPICEALGVAPIRLGVGLSTRINPLDMGPLGQGWESLSREETIERAQIIFSRWLVLLKGLISSQRIGETPVPFGPSEGAAVEHALRSITGYQAGVTTLKPVTIPLLWHALNSPTEQIIADCRYDSEVSFFNGTRTLRDALRQLVSGPLAGLFDAPTNIDIDWRAPIQSLSLKGLSPLGDEAVGIGLTCVNSWGTGMREIAEQGDRRVVVRDEAWRQARLGPGAVRSFDADLRVSRTTGDIQWVVLHKPGDLASAGPAGSQEAVIAKEMLHLCDIRILHGQDAHIAGELDELLDMGELAQAAVTGWASQARGRALWCVGPLMYRVKTQLHALELGLTDTNSAIEGRAAA